MYVINPALIYLSEVASSLKSISIIIFVFLLIGYAVVTIVGFSNILENMEYGPDDRDYKRGIEALNISKKLIIPLVISFVLTIVVPSKEAIYKMIVANLVTYENVDMTTETIEEAFDHVIDKLGELKGE